MNRNERQLSLPWPISRLRRRRATRQMVWRFGDRERQGSSDPNVIAASAALRRRRGPVETAPHAHPMPSVDHRSAELAARLPKCISFGLIRPMGTDETWGRVGALAEGDGVLRTRSQEPCSSSPLLGVRGLLATSPVPSERETLWELLSLGGGQRAVVVLDPAVSTPIFPRHPVADALAPRLGHRGRFNPHFLDPALFRHRIFPVLSELAGVVDGELDVLITVPALLRAADIPPFPLLWRLERLATVVPSDVRIAIELREAEYLTDDFAAFLGETGWIPVISSWLDASGWKRQWASTYGAKERIVRISPRSSALSPPISGPGKRRCRGAVALGSAGDPGPRRRLASRLLDSDGVSTVLVDDDPVGQGHVEVHALAREVVNALADPSPPIGRAEIFPKRPPHGLVAER